MILSLQRRDCFAATRLAMTCKPVCRGDNIGGARDDMSAQVNTTFQNQKRPVKIDRAAAIGFELCLA
jgi:hypothetical protein